MHLSEIFTELNRLIERGARSALATIIAGEGSTPRKIGAKMLIRSDGSIMGTIGGGIVEAQVIKCALFSMKTRRLEVASYNLRAMNDPDTDMRCGGSMTVMIEPVIPPDPVFIFGGGHVGFAIYNILSTLDFNITIVDDRKLYASHKRFPLAKGIICSPFEKAFEKLSINEQAHIIICTRAHKNDEVCLRQAFKTPACYIGMLGSRTKVAAFKKVLREDGIPPRRVNQLHSPIGLSIGAVTPEEIAVSVAAELIQFRASRSQA